MVHLKFLKKNERERLKRNTVAIEKMTNCKCLEMPNRVAKESNVGHGAQVEHIGVYLSL